MKRKNNSKKIIIEISKDRCRVNTDLNCDEEVLLIGMTVMTRYCMDKLERVDKDKFKRFLLKNIDNLDFERSLKVIEGSKESI